VDVWSVLQHLGDRRAVVVCGGPDSHHGVGKSALLDAVHRSFSLQMGGVCVAVHLRALSDPDVISGSSALGWIEKVKARVQFALEEYQDLWRLAGHSRQRPPVARRRASSCLASSVSVLGVGATQALRNRKAPASRSVSRGFHPLSDPIATQPALEELVTAMTLLTEFCEECSHEWPGVAAPGGRTSGVRILLLLDECDHLIQQRHFQDALADVLRRCASYSVVLSTQQQMVETGGGWFKVVHQPVAGLAPKDAARLFLRRAHRPLYWDELLPSTIVDGAESQAAEESASSAASASSGTPRAAASSAAPAASQAARSAVVMTRENEAEVLARVAGHPVVAAQKGNPRGLIELASQVRTSLSSLSELLERLPKGSFDNWQARTS